MVVGFRKEAENSKLKNVMNKILLIAIAFAMALTVTVNGQVAPGTPVPLGGYLQDQQGNLYQVVLQRVTPAAAPVAAAPVAAAPVVVQQPAQQVFYVQQPAPAKQPSPVADYLKKTVVTGAGGAGQGAVIAAVKGEKILPNVAAFSAGGVANQLVQDGANALLKR